MAKKNSTTSNTKNSTSQGKLVSYLVVFVVGFLAGIAFTVFKSDPGVAPQTSTQEKQDQGPDEKTRNQILQLEADVTAQPENFQSWIQLGHLYYDTNQPQKAIGAYTKSLEFHSGDANLLTDLGVMYRRTKQPEQALSYFDQAIAKDSTHIPSRLNKGIVQFYDLGDKAGAIASWEGLLKINPDARTGNGQLIKDFVAQLKAETGKQ